MNHAGHRTLALALLLLCTCVRAQTTLRGSLTDETTGEPVGFATVYLDGTSRGTTSDDAGRFVLDRVVLPAALVVSHLNYETVTLALTDGSAVTQPLALRLTPREETLTSVSVSDANGRAKNVAEFRKRLLGPRAWADRCELRNDGVLVFDRDYDRDTVRVPNAARRAQLRQRQHRGASWNADSSRYAFRRARNLSVRTRGPLTVTLPHLGYVLRADYQSFLIDYDSGRTAYLGSYFFEPVVRPTRRQLANRRLAYLGSAMHFARALTAGTLTENGFRVYEVVRGEAGVERTTEYDLRQHLRPNGEQGHVLIGLAGREFVVLYYADARFRPLPKAKWRRTEPVQSSLFVDGNRCLIYPGGVYGDALLAFGGDIGSRGLAYTLPREYVYDGR